MKTPSPKISADMFDIFGDKVGDFTGFAIMIKKINEQDADIANLSSINAVA